MSIFYCWKFLISINFIWAVYSIEYIGVYCIRRSRIPTFFCKNNAIKNVNLYNFYKYCKFVLNFIFLLENCLNKYNVFKFKQ